MKPGDLVTLNCTHDWGSPGHFLLDNIEINDSCVSGDFIMGEVGLVLDRRDFGEDEPWCEVVTSSGVVGWIPVKNLDIVG